MTLYSSGFWELVADGQEAPFIEGGGETPLLARHPTIARHVSLDDHRGKHSVSVFAGKV